MNLTAPQVSSRHPPVSRCFGTMPCKEALVFLKCFPSQVLSLTLMPLSGIAFTSATRFTRLDVAGDGKSDFTNLITKPRQLEAVELALKQRSMFIHKSSPREALEESHGRTHQIFLPSLR